MTPEAQNQIDYMVKKYQETIQKFDQSEVVNREIEKENKNLKSLVKALESKFDSLAGDVSRLAQTLASSVEMQQGKNEANSILNLKFQDSLSALRKDLSDSITESVKTNTKLDGSYAQSFSLGAYVLTGRMAFTRLRLSASPRHSPPSSPLSPPSPT